MNKKNQNIVIINSVPINGGDEALLKATIAILEDTMANAKVFVLCNNPVLYKEYLPDIKLDWDWEYAFLRSDSTTMSLVFKIKRKLRYVLNTLFKLPLDSRVSRLLGSKRENRVYKILNEADCIVSSAGGYFHDFYGYEKRLSTLEFIHHTLKKPYFIFYQSVGPFWEKQYFEKLNRMFTNAQKVILREAYSLNHLKAIGYNSNNVVVSNDIAFYLNKTYGASVNLDRSLKKIAINFREWRYESQSEDTLEKAVRLCEKLLNEGYELTFISTCQGVKGYTDDSDYAMKIVNRLDNTMRSRIHINKEKLSLEAFMAFLQGFDAYIGMRLHCAILSMIAGIPVLNIAYEDKSLGIFKSLRLAECCFSYKDNISDWFTKVDGFIGNYSNNLKLVSEKRKEAETIVELDFKKYIENN